MEKREEGLEGICVDQGIFLLAFIVHPVSVSDDFGP